MNWRHTHFSPFCQVNPLLGYPHMSQAQTGCALPLLFAASVHLLIDLPFRCYSELNHGMIWCIWLCARKPWITHIKTLYSLTREKGTSHICLSCSWGFQMPMNILWGYFMFIHAQIASVKVKHIVYLCSFSVHVRLPSLSSIRTRFHEATGTRIQWIPVIRLEFSCVLISHLCFNYQSAGILISSLPEFR